MLDIAISVILGFLAALMGYLGVHLTLHSPESSRDKNLSKSSFGVLAALSVILIICQGVRNNRSQERFQADVRSARNDAKAAKDESVEVRKETDKMRMDLNGESARRQQAERDMALIVQKTGAETRVGVAEDIRKAPIRIDMKPGTTPHKITAQFLRRGAEQSPPYQTEFLVLTNQPVTPVKLLIECKNEILDASAQVIGLGVLIEGGWGGKVSAHQYGIGILSPAWTPSSPLLVTVRSNQKERSTCKFSLQ